MCIDAKTSSTIKYRIFFINRYFVEEKNCCTLKDCKIPLYTFTYIGKESIP